MGVVNYHRLIENEIESDARAAHKNNVVELFPRDTIHALYAFPVLHAVTLLARQVCAFCSVYSPGHSERCSEYQYWNRARQSNPRPPNIHYGH